MYKDGWVGWGWEDGGVGVGGRWGWEEGEVGGKPEAGYTFHLDCLE